MRSLADLRLELSSLFGHILSASVDDVPGLDANPGTENATVLDEGLGEEQAAWSHDGPGVDDGPGSFSFPICWTVLFTPLPFLFFPEESSENC